jgi:alkylation response protein AidB-like acyl-CoA dehydrogenase
LWSFGGLLAASDNAALKAEVIPGIIDGSCMGSLASTEAQSRYEMSDVATTATAADGGFNINGEKTVVANGGTADKFIVTARHSGEQFDRAGISLFLIDASAPGVEVKSYKMMDGQSAATVTFKDVMVPAGQLLNTAGEGMDLIDQVMPQILIGSSVLKLWVLWRR